MAKWTLRSMAKHLCFTTWVIFGEEEISKLAVLQVTFNLQTIHFYQDLKPIFLTYSGNAHALNKYMKDTLSGFGKWALNEASPPLEDSSLLQNTSYTKIKNPMYNLDLLFT